MATPPDKLSALIGKLSAHDRTALQSHPLLGKAKTLLLPLLELYTSYLHIVSLIAFDEEGRLFCVRRTFHQRDEGVLVLENGQPVQAWNYPGGVGLWGGGVGLEDFLYVLRQSAGLRRKLLNAYGQGKSLDWQEVIRLASRRAIERELGAEELKGFFDVFRPDDLRDISCGVPLQVKGPDNAPASMARMQMRSIFLLKRPVPFTAAPMGKYGKPTLLSYRVPFERLEGSGILFLTRAQMLKLEHKTPSKASPRNIMCWDAALQASPQGSFRVTDPLVFSIPGFLKAFGNTTYA